jgi:DNA (cytosine-5)-methyltransferase 1
MQMNYDQSSQHRIDALVGFSGPGGSSHGLRMAGARTVGIELDQDACDTAVKMGLESIQGDITNFDPRRFFNTFIALDPFHKGLAPRERPLIAQFSPPCPGFSKAGKGHGRQDLPMLRDALTDLAMVEIADAEDVALMWRELLQHDCLDARSALTFEPIRWIAALHPEYVFMEQVPEVLEVWEEYAKVLTAWGYDVWTGKVYAEQYGVPQTRIRAFLIASRISKVVPPTPTHSRYHNRSPKRLDPNVQKWVSMAEALGWGMRQRPYPTVAAGIRSGGADPMMIGGSGARKIITDAAQGEDWQEWRDTDLVGFPRAADEQASVTINGKEYRARDLRSADLPAFTVTEKSRSWVRYPEEPPIAQIAAGRTGGGTPRNLDDPSPTVTSKGTAMWIWDRATYQGPDRAAVAHEVEHGLVANDAGQMVRRLNNQSGTAFDYAWPSERPAPVIAGRGLVTMPGANANRFNGATKSRNDGIRVTVQEAAVLQSFPPEWSFQGTRTSAYGQVGNAVPPLLQYVLTMQQLGEFE